MDAPLPPPSPAGPGSPSPPDVLLRPSYRRLAVNGVIGAVIASALASLVALQLAKPDVPPVEGSASPSADGATIAPVEGLRAAQRGWSADPRTWRVIVEWQAVDGAVRYVVSRDGRRVGDVERPRFVDDDVTPAGRFRYDVVAIDAEDERSKAARTSIRTDALPDDAARVQGRWLIRLKVRSSTIGIGGGQLVVTFQPTCRTGPCDVRWEFQGRRNAGTATRRGAASEGSGSGSFLTLGCHGETISSTVKLSFRVEKARTVGSAWRATRIAGTVVESVPSFSNCLSARNEWTFEASAQG